MAKCNSTKTKLTSQCCASGNVNKPAELNSIYRIVGGKLVDDFIARSAYSSINHKQMMFPEVSLPYQMADTYMEDLITEEMVQRVLAPVLWMIREGKFDRPSRT